MMQIPLVHSLLPPPQMPLLCQSSYNINCWPVSDGSLTFDMSSLDMKPTSNLTR